MFIVLSLCIDEADLCLACVFIVCRCASLIVCVSCLYSVSVGALLFYLGYQLHKQFGSCVCIIIYIYMYICIEREREIDR